MIESRKGGNVMDVASVTKRLEEIRKVVDTLKDKKTRLEIEKANCEKRKAEIEVKCKKDLGIDVSELPAQVASLSGKIESGIAEIEEKLGMKKSS